MKSASRHLLACRRSNGLDDSLPTVKRAEKEAQQDEVAAAGYARQKNFDRTVSEVLDEAQLQSDIRQEIANTWRQTLTERPAGRNFFLHPAFLAGIVAIVAIVVVVALNVRDEMRSFRGDDLVRQLMELASRTPQSSMNVADGPVGDLGDSLFMKGIERFAAPPQFADFEAERMLIHKLDQQPVAQITSSDRLNFFVFEEGAFDVELDPDGKWYLLEDKGWSAVIRKIDGVVFIAARPGTAETLAKKVELAERFAQ